MISSVLCLPLRHRHRMNTSTGVAACCGVLQIINAKNEPFRKNFFDHVNEPHTMNLQQAVRGTHPLAIIPY